MGGPEPIPKSKLQQAILWITSIVDGGHKKGKERIKDSKSASATMMYQACFRYAGTLESDPELRTSDHLGKYFATPLLRGVISIPCCGWSIATSLTERSAPGLYSYSCCRSRLGDAAFLEFLRAHAGSRCQIVNLSGGFCTRFERYRRELEAHAGSCTYLELDFPASQELKLELMARAGEKVFPTPRPPNYHLMQIDYATQSLGDVLLAAGSPFDAAKPTLTLWEGVSMYLEGEAVESVLRFLAGSTPPGSVLQFDAVSEESVAAGGRTGEYGDAEVFRACAAKGEPLKYGVPRSQVGAEAWFRERGWRFVGGSFEANHYGRERLERELLKGKQRSTGCMHICRVEAVADADDTAAGAATGASD